VTLNKNLELISPLRKALQNIRCLSEFSMLLTQTKLFVDEFDRGFRLIAKFRVTREIVFDYGPFTRAPPPSQLFGQAIDQRGH
jgi:hypothetical protein